MPLLPCTVTPLRYIHFLCSVRHPGPKIFFLNVTFAIPLIQALQDSIVQIESKVWTCAMRVALFPLQCDHPL